MEWCRIKKVIMMMLTVGFVGYITLSHVTLDEEGHPIVRFFKEKKVRTNQFINYIIWFIFIVLIPKGKTLWSYLNPLDCQSLVEKILEIEGEFFGIHKCLYLQDTRSGM